MLTLEIRRNVIRIKFISPNLSDRTIAKLCGCSHQSVARILKTAAKCNLTHPLAHQCTNTELNQLLYPNVRAKENSKRTPDYDTALKESLKKKGKSKSLTVQYLQYQSKEPDSAYSKSQYFYIVRKFLKKCRITMRQQHKAGEVTYIDYSGTGVCYEKKGKKIWLKVFVACLGASKKLFAFATPGERTIDWLNGMILMFDYFGGVTEVISIDNAKALVSKAGLIPVLVKNIEKFGEHYDCIIDSCRVGMPQDKSLAELGVKFIKQRILIPMNNDMTFHSQDEVNHYLAKAVEELNNQPFQKFKISRNELFEEIEKQELRPLPRTEFNVVIDFKVIKVPADYHIYHDEHFYSVPYQLAHEQIEVIVNQTQLTVIYQHQVKAIHQLSYEKGGCTTNPEHLSPSHRAESMKTKEEYLGWATTLGSDVVDFIESQYQKTKNPASRAVGKRCQALMKLCEDKGEAAFKEACKYALANHIASNELGLVISALDVIGQPCMSNEQLTHRNIRGKGYYGGRHEQ